MTVKFPIFTYKLDSVIQFSSKKINNDKYLMNGESIELAERPPIDGITRFIIRRKIIVRRVQGNTWKFSEVRCLKNFGFQFPFPNFMLNMFGKRILISSAERQLKSLQINDGIPILKRPEKLNLGFSFGMFDDIISTPVSI